MLRSLLLCLLVAALLHLLECLPCAVVTTMLTIHGHRRHIGTVSARASGSGRPSTRCERRRCPGSSCRAAAGPRPQGAQPRDRPGQGAQDAPPPPPHPQPKPRPRLSRHGEQQHRRGPRPASSASRHRRARPPHPWTAPPPPRPHPPPRLPPPPPRRPARPGGRRGAIRPSRPRKVCRSGGLNSRGGA